MSRKSSSIVLLTTSVVLAVAVFVFATLVKPNDESDVLKKARERQSVPLLSVEKPLEIDQNVLTKEEEMKNSVYELLLNDEEFAKAVANNISNDDAFVSNIYQTLLPQFEKYLDEKVSSYVVEFTPQIEKYVDELYKAEDPTIFVDKLIEPVTARVYNELDVSLTKELQAQLAAGFSSIFLGAKEEVENDIYNRVMQNRDAFVADVLAEVFLSLDESVPEYIEAVKAEILESIDTEIVPIYEQQLKAYIDEQTGMFKDEIKNAVTQDMIEGAVLDVYNKYRNNVVGDIVNEVLLRLDNVAVAEAQETQPISAPTFSNTQTVKTLSDEDYIRIRTERRDAIISDILNKLN